MPDKPALKILIVDDEPLVRAGLKSLLLELSGSFPLEKIAEAEDGAKAREILEKEPMDLLFTDMVMPRLDGLGLLAWAAENRPECRPVVLSCHDDYRYVRGSFQYNVLDYLLKYDIEPRMVEKVLQKLLHDREKEQREGKNQVPGETRAEMREKIRLWIKPGNFIRFLVIYWAGQRVSSHQLEKLFASPGEETSALPLAWDSPSSLVILQSPESLQEEKLFFLVRSLTPRILSENPDDFCLIHSGEIHHSGDLDRSLAQALGWGERGFFLGPGRAIIPRETRGPEKDQWASILARTRMEVLRLLLDRNLAGLQLCLDNLGLKMQEFPLLTIQEAKTLYKELLQLVVQHYGDIRPHLVQSFKDSPNREMEQVPYFYQLGNTLSALLQRISEDEMDLPPGEILSPGIRRALALIHTRFSSPNLGLAEIAGELNYSPAYLSRQFKKETGKNLVAYINELRCREARRMLQTGKYLIYEISERVGFNNYNYFSKIYKKVYGKSPNLDNNNSDPPQAG